MKTHCAATSFSTRPPIDRPSKARRYETSKRGPERRCAGSELTELAEHWPDLIDSALVQDRAGGLVTHAVYCRRMERRLREAREAGVTGIRIAPLRTAEFTQWVADNHPGDQDAAQLRTWHAADLGRDRSRVIAWPPGRNEGCWCGSGRKYKKCCAAPGPDGSR